MTKRKDYVAIIDSETVNRFLQLASDLGLEIETFEGSLIDNHVIYETEKIKVGRVKPRKNIMIREVFLNEWSSDYELTMTDNEQLVSDYVSEMEKQEEAVEEDLATV